MTLPYVRVHDKDPDSRTTANTGATSASCRLRTPNEATGTPVATPPRCATAPLTIVRGITFRRAAPGAVRRSAESCATSGRAEAKIDRGRHS